MGLEKAFPPAVPTLPREQARILPFRQIGQYRQELARRLDKGLVGEPGGQRIHRLGQRNIRGSLPRRDIVGMGYLIGTAIFLQLAADQPFAPFGKLLPQIGFATIEKGEGEGLRTHLALDFIGHPAVSRWKVMIYLERDDNSPVNKVRRQRRHLIACHQSRRQMPG